LARYIMGYVERGNVDASFGIQNLVEVFMLPRNGSGKKEKKGCTITYFHA